MGVQVGEGGTQINYYYGERTWADGVVAPPLVDVSGVVHSPYRGLRPFEERDAAFFFGREAAADELLQRMSRQLDGTGMLVVSGVSGAGKSSLLRAGVLPRLRGAGLASAPGSASWPCLLFSPTQAPLDELSVRVARLAETDAAAVRRGLDSDPAGFALTARQAGLAQQGGAPEDPDRPRTTRRLILMVDQFEQLFTQCADEKERQAFIAALQAAANRRYGPALTAAALVVLGVRSDFEARCADYPQLAEGIQDRYLVTAMTDRQLRLVIMEPAKKAGSSIDDDLVDQMLRELRSQDRAVSGAGALPLLSYALDRAWRGRSGPGLTLADYERTGGIEGALATSAQRVYDRLTPSQRAAARQVFIRLTATGSDAVDTARRASPKELTQGKRPAEVADVEAVLETFAAERLLTLAADTVEISHEVLLTAWPLLRDTWLAETGADRIVVTRLHNAATEWAHGSHDPTFLYRGSQLKAATKTESRIEADPVRYPPLSDDERGFLRASRRARRRSLAFYGLVLLAACVIAGTALAYDPIHDAILRHQAQQLGPQALVDGGTAGVDNGPAAPGAVYQWVQVGSFYLDVHELTNQEYQICVDAGECTVPRESANDPSISENDPDEPVVNVTAYQAADFCAWTDQRLPTAEEWSRAASSRRAAVNAGLVIGDAHTYFGNLRELGNHSLVPVESTEFSAGRTDEGISDLFGNAYEWVATEVVDSDPSALELRDWNGQDPVPKVAIMGGSYREPAKPPKDLLFIPSYVDPAETANDFGFRCAQTK
jgi:hypothetical protein